MAYAQGSIILAPATFKRGVRTYLIVSNQNRPFYRDRYTVAVITSTERQNAVELTASSLIEGELKTYPSYVSPWSMHVFPDTEILKSIAQIEYDTKRTVAAEIRELTRVL